MTSPRSTPAQALRRAAVRATFAPSVHNTQPWRFIIGGGALEVFADQSRRSPVWDPTGRQLLISCGCALFNARVALAAAGYRVRVDRCPDPTRPDLLARLTVTGSTTSGPGADEPLDPEDIGALDEVLGLRRTNRRPFADEAVPPEVVDALVSAALAEGSELVPVTDEDLWLQATLHGAGDQAADRAGQRAWTAGWTGDWSEDGAVAVSGDPPAARAQQRPRSARTTEPCLLLLGTAGDGAESRVRGGEALEHALLEVARRGYAASPSSRLIEVPDTRAGLRGGLRLATAPQVILQVGRAAATPAARRRRLVDVLAESA